MRFWSLIPDMAFIGINDGTSNDLLNQFLAGSESTAGGNEHVYTQLVLQMLDWF